MGYKISGFKSETARVFVLKESDRSIESNTVISGSGDYEILDLTEGAKLIFGRKANGEVIGYGNVSAEYYAPIVGDRGVFAGGVNTSGQENTMDYITISTISDAVNFGDLTVARSYVDGTSNGNNQRGLFAGGSSVAGYENTIDYITISTTVDAINFGDLTAARRGMGGCSNSTNNRGVWGGGQASGPTRSDIIDYVTINSTSDAISFGVLSLTREFLSGTSNGVNNRGVFAGGVTTIYENVIDYITISSTGNALNFGDLTLGRYHLSAVSNRTNDRGVFAGGNRGGSIYQNEIDYITISSTGNASDFGDLTEATGDMRSSVSNGTYDRGVFGGGQEPASHI